MKAFDHEIATQKIVKVLDGLDADTKRSVVQELLKRDENFSKLTVEQRARLSDELVKEGASVQATTTGDAAIVDQALMPVPMPTPVATVQPQDMETLFEFCDQVETICPQPTDPALRKQWREYTKGLFQLKSKTLAT